MQPWRLALFISAAIGTFMRAHIDMVEDHSLNALLSIALATYFVWLAILEMQGKMFKKGED